MERVRVGVIGCGNISDLYLKNCTQHFKILDLAACSDLDEDRAREKCNKYHIPRIATFNEMLEDPEIEIILNLTTPRAHAKVNLAALEAGKSVYSEKPLAVTIEDGKKITDLAKKKGLLVGCAPDAFLGGGIQTCRKLIDDGLIGKPVAAFAFFADHGPECWHPDPEYYYQVGAGPLFEIGPYLLTALINLIGPVKSITGSAKITHDERVITCQPKFGKKIKVETPTHITGVIDFKDGAVGTIMTSYDIWHTKLPPLEIYGTEGSLSLAVPLYEFGGPVLYRKSDAEKWEEMPLTHGYTEVLRGLGLADMAYSLRNGKTYRTNGELAYHVLEIINGFFISAEKGRRYKLISSCEKPEPMPAGLSLDRLE